MQAAGEKPQTFMAEALQRMRRAMVYVLLFSLCTNLLLMALPIYSLQVLDRVISSASMPTLIYLTIVILCAFVFYGMFCMVRSSILTRVGEWLDSQVSGKLLSLGVAQNAMGSPVQASRHLRDVQSIKAFITGNGVTSLFDAPWSILYLLVIYLISPVLGFVAVVGAVVLLLLGILNEFATRKTYALAGRVQMRAMEMADSATRNAEAIEAMGMMGHVSGRWQEENARAQSLQVRAAGRANLIQNISRVIRMCIQIGITGFGAYLAINHEITTGGMIAASILSGRGLAPFEAAIGLWKSLISARDAYQRLEKAITASGHGRGTVELPQPEGRLTVENAVFGIPGQKPIIKGVSFALEPGEALGIIGPSAAGKSTLAKLIIGVLPTSNGAVRLDGAEIFKWNRELLGPYVGYMPQQVELFSGTILENIARMQPEPDHHAVISAAKMAGVHELILQLPEGYETVVRPGNMTLSPGQRQRIGLARALYGTPKLVVLDEPNSSLDGEGEQALIQALGRIREQGITSVVIAHRPSLARYTDKILMLQQGLVAEFGATQEVLSKYVAPKVQAIGGGRKA